LSWKEDLPEAKERLKAWWDHELLDRPCIQYYHPRADVKRWGLWDNWYLAKKPDAIEGALKDFEKNGQTIFWGAECTPHYVVNYGPGILASVFGCEGHWENRAQTVWFDCPTPVDEIIALLERTRLDDNNPWYTRIKRVTEYAAQQAAGVPYQVTITDLGGVLDILASFLTPKGLILAMRRHPDIVDTCRAIILEKWLQLFDELEAIIGQHLDGFGTWLRIWCPKTWYPIQCDFSAMLSPSWFERFALPDIITQAEHMKYAIYHLDGPNEIPYVDMLLQVSSLSGIQCVPGIQGTYRDPKWVEVYKKIQAAGKNLVLDVPPADLSFFYEEFDPKGLLINSIFNSKSQAETYLPEFIGGRGGKDEAGKRLTTSPGQFRVL